MSILNRVFEAKVRVGKVIKAYLYYTSDGVRTHKQAAQKAKKHGKVISVEKVDTHALLGRIENLDLTEDPMSQYLGGGVFEDDLNLDEVLGLRKKTKRRSSDGRTYKDTKED